MKCERKMMIGYRDRMSTQQEAAQQLNQTPPIRAPTLQAVDSRIKAKFRNIGHVRNLPKSGRPRKPEKTN